MQIFSVSSDRLRTIVDKMKTGEISPIDQRGKHLNRPNRTAAEITQMIEDHIKQFPTYESHYTRKAGDPLRLYLNPELSICKMYRLFLELHQLERNDVKEWLYRDIFKRKFRLRFGSPKQDTCDRCDSFKAKLKDAPSEELQIQYNSHLDLSSDTYQAYKLDCERSKAEPNLTVLTCDLQQVIFSPSLSNSSSFYLRKVSNFNFGVHSSVNNNAAMFNWNELTGRRGSNEIASCIWKYCVQNFQPLQEGQTRELIVWLDRCIGQNNNFMVITMLMALVWTKYFTKVHQKFLLTGHSFNDCDRDFGLIEKQLKTSTIITPTDIEKAIIQARVQNPFTVVQITQNDIKDFMYLSTVITRPPTLKVTKHLWFSYDIGKPNEILTKRTHNNEEEWEIHNLVNPFLTFRIDNLRKAYEGPLQMEKTKLKDLKKLLEFLDGQNLTYYLYIVFEQERLFDELDVSEDEI